MTCTVSKINDNNNKSVKDERWTGERELTVYANETWVY